MKTMKILVAVVTALSINLSSTAKNNVTAAESHTKRLSQPTSKTVVNGNYKIVYSTDEKGRVVAKIILRKSPIEYNRWVPESAYSVFYGESKNVLTFGKWNGREFRADAEQVRYDANDYPVLISMPG